MDLEDKLNEVEKNYRDLEERLSDPSVASNPLEVSKLARRYAELGHVVSKYREYKEVASKLRQAREILESESDEEMRQLAHEELRALEPQLEELEAQIKLLLLPRDPNDNRNVIVEIRAGAGGEEASLFAAVLFRMYMRYAERKGWTTEMLSSSETGLKGFKEVIFRIEGEGAYSLLKYESGVHRVQRVPVTEASGRIHTSTATVAVLPEAEEVDVHIDPDDLKIDTFRASGAGGQYVNMTDSAVRITHLPTGIVVTCQDERSQLKNRVKAMQLLRAKLYEMETKKQEDELAAERKGQIGTAERSERIRTYNYPQNRVTDHRIGLTLYKLDQILDGDLDELIEALVMADQSERLKRLEA